MKRSLPSGHCVASKTLTPCYKPHICVTTMASIASAPVVRSPGPWNVQKKDCFLRHSVSISVLAMPKRCLHSFQPSHSAQDLVLYLPRVHVVPQHKGETEQITGQCM